MAMCKVSSTVHFVTRSAGSAHEGARAHWVPNTDVYSTDNGLVIKVELSGMRSEHLEITVEGNRLRISGTRPDGCRAAKCNFLVMEINYGPFESVLEVPPVTISARPKQLTSMVFCGSMSPLRNGHREAPRCQSPRGIPLLPELFRAAGI